jgi:hypothetical protein
VTTDQRVVAKQEYKANIIARISLG